MHRRFPLMMALLGIAAPAAFAADSVFVTPPYLQSVAPDSITIMWESRSTSPVHVVTEPPAGRVKVFTEPSGADTTIYRARLTGLSSGTTYAYAVLQDGETLEGRTFTTAPAGPAEFSFAVWSDSQGTNHGAYEENEFEPTVSMMKHMAASGVDFAVTSGDLAENGAAYDHTRMFYLDRVALHLGQTVPWFNAWGNHDAGRGASIRQFADMPSRLRAGFDPGWGSFSFDYGGCHFVCIDYNTMRKDIAEWLESDLQTESAQHARFTFLFIHVPPYCELWIDGDKGLREGLVPIMEEYGVDACFSGHTHEYERGYLNGVNYVVTGGGSWLDFGEPVIKDWPHMFVGGVHDLEGYEHGLVNEYVKLDVGLDGWAAEVHAFNFDGSHAGIVDTFTSDAADSDGDGLLDVNEKGLGLDPDTADMDGDGLNDAQEAVTFETKPDAGDTDGDGADDLAELRGGADPLKATQVLAGTAFDELEGALQPAEDENLPADALGWTHQAPAGWRIDNAAMGEPGVAEWTGWSFATVAFWDGAGGQGRAGFTLGDGVIAIADPDEWDDKNRPAQGSVFDSALVAPPVQAQAGEPVYVSFDSDWRPEGGQTADVVYSYNGGVEQVLMRYDLETGERRSERVTLQVPAPMEDAELQLKWRLHGARNNWWWAIDDVRISNEPETTQDEGAFEGRHAVIIGIDGVRVDSYKQAETPHLDALAANGLHSLSARSSAGQMTVSGPCWSSILTGVWADRHGVYDNSFTGANYGAHPTLFTFLRAKAPAAYLATVVNWAPINEQILTNADLSLSGMPDEEVAERAAAQILEEGPEALFVHLDEVDAAGHASGYHPESAPYREAVEKADALAGQVIAAVAQRMERHPEEEWLIVALADHGGTADGHHAKLSQGEVLVPLMFAGPGVPQGQLDGDAAIVDVVPTVLGYLGVPANPARFDGRCYVKRR